MQINRLLEIVYVLMEKKAVTARELSERFGVSQRTTYRDIDTLSYAGIPLYTEKGKGGGISLLPEFVLNKSLLNEHEQNEILSALQVFSGAVPSQTENVLKKMSSLFRKEAADWLQVNFFGKSSIKNTLFNDLKTAILDRRIIEFDYYSANGKKTRRSVEPLQLSFYSKAWYINAFCLKRKDLRMFKLTRIRDLKITKKHFLSRDSIKINSVPEDEQQEQYLSFKFSIEPEMTYRVYDEFDDEMIEKQPDGSFIVKVTWPIFSAKPGGRPSPDEDHWIYGFILSFGEYIEVLEPESFKKIIKEKAEKIAKKYS